jgi:uncharacterized membrane protein
MNWIKDNWLLLFLAAVITIAGYSSWELVQYVKTEFLTFFPKNIDRGEWGALGDLFGGLLNPFFALLGLIMLLVTLFQNQKELYLSRKEFAESANALKSQADTLEKQRFEDTFFSLLDQHNIALTNILQDQTHFDDEGKQSSTVGMAESRRVYFFGGGSYYPLIENFLGLKSSRNKLFKENYKIHQYFRILYQVLKFINTNCPSQSEDRTLCTPEEKLYSNITRSLLSEDVYLLLAINCACEDNEDTFYKYRELIERYSFLEHMPINFDKAWNEQLIKDVLDLYEDNAFGENPVYKKYVT